jgi:putative nucleotidyltransferase with HDIG domain
MPESLEKKKGHERVPSDEPGPVQVFWKRASQSKRLESFRSFFDAKKQRWILILVTSLIAAFMMAPKPFKGYQLTVDEPSRESIISPVTFQVVDEIATAKNKDEALKAVLPVYDYDDDMVRDVQARVTSAFYFMRSYLAAEAKYNSGADRTPKDAAVVEGETGRPAVEPQPFRPLEEHELKTRFENLLGTAIAQPCFEQFKIHGFSRSIERNVANLVVTVLLRGVTLSRDLLMKDGKRGIYLFPKSKEKLELVKDVSGSILDYKEAIGLVNSTKLDIPEDPDLDWAVRRTAADLVNVNISYNRERSAAEKQKALANIKPVYFQVLRGEPIVREGEPVTAAVLQKLDGLLKANPPGNRCIALVGFAIILMLLLRLSSYYCEVHLNRTQSGVSDLLLFCLLLVGTILITFFFASLRPLAESTGQVVTARSMLYLAPVAAGSMMMALMVDARAAFIFTAIFPIAASFTAEGDIYLLCFYFISGVVGLHGMTRAAGRTDVLKGGLVVGVVNMVSIVAIRMALGNLSELEDLYEAGFGFLGGLFSGLLVLGAAPLLEHAGYITNIGLLELANLNHPMLKRLSMEAPGTYHHSILVGTLAENAAAMIGANPHLARVGAYYHDIGKVAQRTKPTYFVENQQGGINPHDRLEPNMSALILISHVKHGVEKARDYGLAPAIVDIIQQHHGDGLLKVFYHKALERAAKDHNNVSEDKFRYPGPKPQTKEAALVMMADVVEAAARTFTDFSHQKIKQRVHALIMGLFTEGQLDNSTLTLKDLNAVTKSFARSLRGVLHSRLEYPEEIKADEKVNGDSPGQRTDKAPLPGQRDFAEEGPTRLRRVGV